MSNNNTGPPSGLTARARSSALKARTFIRTRITSDNTFVVGLVAAIAGFLSLFLHVALVVWNAIDIFNDDSPAFFNSIFLVFNAVFVMNMLSIYWDRNTNYELFDFWTAFFVGILTLGMDIFLLVIELGRYFDCPPGGSSTIGFTICNSFNSKFAIVPWFVVAIFFLFAVKFVLLIIWYTLYEKYRIFTSAQRLAASTDLQQRDFSIRAGARRRLALIRANFREVSNVGIAIVATVILIVIFATAVIAMFQINGDFPGWYKNGGFLILPAAYAGAEFAFFGVTPYSWAVFCFVIGIFALGSLGIGLAFEIPRFFHCVNGTSSSAFDDDVCNNEGWRAYLLPSVMTFVAILTIIAFVLVTIRMVRGRRLRTPAVEKVDIEDE